MNFYIADMHFGHKNVIRYDNRPFDSIEEMDKAIMFLAIGSISRFIRLSERLPLHKEEKTAFILGCLKGHKVLIKGNHDHISPKVARYFDRICEYAEITDGEEKVVMSHYPMPFWNGHHRNSIHLYGHVHNSHQYNYCLSIEKELRQLQDIPMRMFNVGCMMTYMNYIPRTLNEILESKGGAEDGQK